MGADGRVARLDRGLRRRAERLHLRAVEGAAGALGRDPVIVYTLPKTGSSAFAASLESLRVARPVFQVHLLSDGGMARAQRLESEGARIRAAKIDKMALARAAIDDAAVRPLVVTMTRHPLRRAISWFFQSWHRDFPWAAPGPQDPGRVDDLVARFHERLPLALDVGDRWFDEELAAVTGHDVFAAPFDVGVGWAVHRLAGCDLAVVRTEDLDATFGPVTRRLLGHPLRLRRVNVAEDKPYADLRSAFLARLSLSPEEAGAVADTRHARHFYSPREVAAGVEPFLAVGGP